MKSNINYLKIKEHKKILSAFNTLKNEFFSFNGDLELFVQKIYENGICVICEEDELCGVIAFYANDIKTQTAFITSLLVSKSARGKGIGTNLIKTAENISREYGMKKMCLEVNVKNTAAISLYEKLGYIQTRKQENSMHMEKILHL